EARVEIAQHEIGVGDGGLEAAQAVARGPGIRARTVGTHAEETAFDPRPAAASGADLDQVQTGNLHGQAAALAHADQVDLELVRARGNAVLDEGGLGGGAAHVEGDEVPVPGEPSDVRGEDGARRGPRVERAHGEGGGRIRGGDAAVVLHDVETPGEAALLEPGAEGVEVLREARGDVGVDHGGVGPLVLAVLGRDVDGEDHGQAGQ